MGVELEIRTDERLYSERKLIEFYDRSALERIVRRFGCNRRIAIIKYEEGYDLCDTTREAELVEMMEREFGSLPPGFVREFYDLVLRYKKEIVQGVVDGIEGSS